MNTKTLKDKTSLSILKKDEEKNNSYISIPYSGKMTQELARNFREFNIDIAHKNTGKLGEILQNPKDVDRNVCNQSGIYKLNCEKPGCKAIYIRETRRTFIKQYGEHIDDTMKPLNEESAMAHHAIFHFTTIIMKRHV